MKTFGFKGLIAATVLLGTTAAQAATLYTAPMRISGSDSLVCSMLNASTSATPKTVRVDVVSDSGLVLSTSGDVSLGGGATIERSASIGLFTPERCVFTVSGGRRLYRAQGCVVHPGSSCDAATPAQ